jgi:hypothetical protein
MAEVKMQQAIGRRAVLKKQGSRDVRVSVEQSGQGTFTATENGVSSAIWPKYSPEQLKSGNNPEMTLDRAWQTVLAKYPDYEVIALEELTPDEEKAS